MKPASKRSTRSNITLHVGPLSVSVNVYSGVAKPESPKTYCTGSGGRLHPHTELKSAGRYCPACGQGNDTGTLVQAFKAEDGALVPIESDAIAERLEDVSGLRDDINLVSVSATDYADTVIESSNVYWLTENKTTVASNYLGLLQSISDNGVILVGAWASRSVAKLYRVGVSAGRLTLTELIPVGDLRSSPDEPVTADEKSVAKAAAAFTLLAEAGTREDVEQLSIDPGRAALQRAASAARAAGAEELVVKRGDRVMFEQRAAEASLLAELEKEKV